MGQKSFHCPRTKGQLERSPFIVPGQKDNRTSYIYDREAVQHKLKHGVSKTLSALRQFPSREICSPDIFSRQTLSAMRVKDTFSPETLSVVTISALRHLRLRETFSRETLSALRHLRLRETFSWEKLSVGRNFQPREQLGDTFNPETISASRHFQPQNIFSLEKL